MSVVPGTMHPWCVLAGAVCSWHVLPGALHLWCLVPGLYEPMFIHVHSRGCTSMVVSAAVCMHSV